MRNKTPLANKYESVDFKVRIFLFIIDIIGSILFLPFKMLNKIAKRYNYRNIRKILILRMDGLGDLVLSSAAIREIRRGFPNAEITLAVGSWNEEIAKCIPCYDNLIVHDCFLFSFFRGNRKIRFKEELNFIKRLKQSNYDLGIDLRGDLLSIIPLFLSGARFRFAKDTRGGGFLLTHVVKWNRRCIKHEKDKTLRYVEALGISVANEDLELHIQKKNIEYVESYLWKKGVKQFDLLVTIAPCALYYWRSWRPERFAQVVLRIANDYKCKVVLVGTRGDRGILDEINELADRKTINSAGDLTLTQVVALIRKSTVFIGNDSGLTHIAAAVKTPMIQLFGPGEPDKFAYTGNKDILLMKTDCPYHPCTQQVCKYQEHWCMDQISVEDVMRAFDKIAKAESDKFSLNKAFC